MIFFAFFGYLKRHRNYLFNQLKRSHLYISILCRNNENVNGCIENKTVLRSVWVSALRAVRQQQIKAGQYLCLQWEHKPALVRKTQTTWRRKKNSSSAYIEGKDVERMHRRWDETIMMLSQLGNKARSFMTTRALLLLIHTGGRSGNLRHM